MKYKTIPSSQNLYFVSSVIAKHRSIFWSDQEALIPLNSLSWFRNNGFWKLYAFCLMPNHLHIVVRLRNDSPIAKVMGEFHKYTGHELVKLFKSEDKNDLLDFFADAARTRGDRNYLIWEDAVARSIEQENVLLDLLEYTHNNPLSKRWRLVEDRADYRYSSACYYDRGVQPLIPVDDLHELLEPSGQATFVSVGRPST